MVYPSGTVTLLFTDIEGSTRLWETDQEAMTGALARHDQIIRESVEAAGGHVFKTVGDAFCAVFADASVAVACSVEVQRALGAEHWPESSPIRVRMSLHSGVCVERDSDYFGPVVNRVARVLAVGHGGQILCSETTYNLVADRLDEGLSVRDLGAHRLKDLSRPERVFQLNVPGMVHEFGPLRSLDHPAVRHNLPLEATSFVGRVAELSALRSLMSGGSRLITLTGAGGAGKTRLALQVAAEAVDGTGDGVWLVELAPLADPELVGNAVAAVLGVHEEPGRPILDILVDAVADRYLLIVLDNAEHVIDATAKLADTLLRSCPRVSLLATSREPLGIGGEHIFRVPSLSVPPPNLTAPEQLDAFEAVQLFVERASRQRPGFDLDVSNAPDVAAICIRLDGIPLAIELAAARVHFLSVSEINSLLDQRLRLLTGGNRSALPRHQTLRALLDWSYELLNPHEQHVLDRLSVFTGGWTLQAAEMVTSGGVIDDWEVMNHLAGLVSKSLVQADEVDGSTRYRLLETVRYYAAERLAMRPDSELEVTRRAHRDNYLALTEAAAEHLHGPEQLGWLDRLELEFDNLRTALAFSVADPENADSGLRMAVGLRWFCAIRGHGGEILDALTTLLARPDASKPTLIRAQALTLRCVLLERFGEYSTHRSIIQEAIEISRNLGDASVTADALRRLIFQDYSEGSLSVALANMDEAVELARATGHPPLISSVLSDRAYYRGDQGNWSGAFADHEEALALARAAGDISSVAFTLEDLGYLELTAGQLQTARAHLEEASALASDLRCGVLFFTELPLYLGLVDILEGDPRSALHHFLESLAAARLSGAKTGIPYALLGLALSSSGKALHSVAATLHGVADKHMERTERALEHFEAGLRERDQTELRALLGNAAFDVAYERGCNLSQADAIALAVAAESPQ